MLAHLGFRKVDFPYIQPPLKPEGKAPCGDMLLLAYVGPVCTVYDGTPQVSRSSVLAWVAELATSIFESNAYEAAPWWEAMADTCTSAAQDAELLPLPWKSSVLPGVVCYMFEV